MERACVLPRVGYDVPDVSDEDGEDEDAHQPGGRHEEDLGHVRRLLVLPDRRGRLRGEVEAPDVGVTLETKDCYSLSTRTVVL